MKLTKEVLSPRVQRRASELSVSMRIMLVALGVTPVVLRLLGVS